MIKKAFELLTNENALKAYSKPKLVNFGKVEEITKGTTGSQSDLAAQLPS